MSTVVAIAGALENVGGSAFEYDVTRLKTSDSNSDSQKEGLRLVLKGGKHPLSGPVKERRPQRAIIELICDQDKKGTEGEWESEDKYESSTKLRTRDDQKDPKDGDDKKKDGDGEDDGSESGVEHQLKKPDAALLWEGYHEEKDADVLRLTWLTKAACEKRDDKNNGDKNKDEGDESASSHWGFFTWFVIM